MTGNIIITGASAGIGKATAKLFLDKGWTVGLLARRVEPLNAMVQAHKNAIGLPADVTDDVSVDAAFATFTERAGHLDVLFNNAGISVKPAPIDEIDPQDWRAAVDVNLTGMFLCARAAFGAMRHQTPQGGRIINNGSISSYAPRWGSVPYTSTKHGVLGLTKTLALDGRPFNIACGQIDIGNALTDMTASMETGMPQADGTIKPEPTVHVKHIAAAVLHMAGLPLEANILSMNVMATAMPFVGRG